MVTDARGHVVPAGAEPPKRQAFLDLSDSIADVRPVSGQTEAEALVTSLTAAGLDPKGLVCYFSSPGLLYFYSGTDWVALATQQWATTTTPRVARGSISVAGKPDVVRSRKITFPSGRFRATPQVVLTPGTGANKASGTNTEYWVTDVSTTNFGLNVNRSNDTTIFMRWVAIHEASPAPLAWPFAEIDLTPDSLVTCSTGGCPNEGIPIELTPTRTDEETGELVPVDAIDCGVCGADITDTLEEASP